MSENRPHHQRRGRDIGHFTGAILALGGILGVGVDQGVRWIGSQQAKTRAADAAEVAKIGEPRFSEQQLIINALAKKRIEAYKGMVATDSGAPVRDPLIVRTTNNKTYLAYFGSPTGDMRTELPLEVADDMIGIEVPNDTGTQPGTTVEAHLNNEGQLVSGQGETSVPVGQIVP